MALGITLSAQEITSSIVGTVTDASGAVIPGATVKLTESNTSFARTAQSGRDGVFHFPNLGRGTYNATVTANGFQTHRVNTIILGVSSTRDLGKIALQVGNQSQEVTVTAAATPIQTSSSEVSHTIQGSALDALPLVGRDVFGAMQLDAGVVQTPPGGDFAATNPSDISYIHIDGNTQAANLTIDGITAVDTGSNGSTHYSLNEGAVEEVKVLSSNYSAEYGRNSGGQITLVTKSGGNKLHGELWAYHRHEEFNANTWSNNQSSLPRPLYRYNIDGFDVGGPMPFGWLKNRLYWFASQEYTNQLGSNTVEKRTTPTAAEEGLDAGQPGGTTCGAGCADFSQLVDGKGKPILLWNPATNAPFPNNQIPASQVNAQGLAMLEFFPLPNYTPPAGSSLVNQVNFEQQASAPTPETNTVIRIDFNPTSKLTSYFRWDNQAYTIQSLFNNQQFNIAPITHGDGGHGYVWSGTYVLSPTLINTTTVGKSWDTYNWVFASAAGEAQASRSSTLNPPTLFAMPTTPKANGETADGSANGYANLLPAMSFGGGQPNLMSLGTATAPYYNSLDVYTVDDDVSKVAGPHQLKMGIYLEYNVKLQPAGNGYAGSYSFGTDSTNPTSTTDTANPNTYAGDGYANAILGDFDSYSQNTARTVFDVSYWNAEWYVQDSWRVTRKLNLDLGMRFYHQTPQIDMNNTFSVFNPSLYTNQVVKGTPTAAGILYVPACAVANQTPCSKVNQRSEDPNTGAMSPAAYIGAYVPEANPLDGIQVLGKNGVSPDPYTNAWVVAAPRIGFAYDVFGNGKTAFRGGFGVFYDRLDGNQVYNMSGQAGTVATQTVSQGTFANFPSSGVVAPATVNFWNGKVPLPKVENASLGVEQELPGQTALDVSWVGNYSKNTNLTENINAVPLGANFNPANISAVTGSALTQDDSSQERTAYPGLVNLNQEVMYGHSNYNSLQASLEHRLVKGLLFGVAYTWSRNLGVTSYDPLVANNNARNYGPISTNRDQTLVINYSWALPGVANRFAGALLNHWTFAGLTTFNSGAPYSQGFTGVGDLTGSTNEGSRLTEISNPLENVPAGDIFNPAAFSVPVANKTVQLGDLGVNAFNYPGWQNWDMGFTKFIPVGFNEGSGFNLNIEAYNVFNHPEFTGFGTNVSNTSSAGKPTGTNAARILSFNLRYSF